MRFRRNRRLVFADTTDSALLRLLKLAVGASVEVPQWTPEVWQQLFDAARRHALVGVTWRAIESLPAACRPPKSVLLEWCAMAERIRKRNRRIDEAVVDLVDCLRKAGFRPVVLKGWGLAQFYPDAALRMAGDIDVWVDGGRQRVLRYVRRFAPAGEVRYHHVRLPLFQDVEVEVHFTPSWMNVPWQNRRLQAFFDRERERQAAHGVAPVSGDGVRVPVPAPAFNAVYVLVHIFRHLLGEGVGLRQVMDYYYVLRVLQADERRMVADELRGLGLCRFAAAMMYVLQVVFGLQDEYCLLPPDEEAGRFLLQEILCAGNFGQYDARLQRRKYETSLFRFRRSVCRNVRFLKYYPAETVADPFFKVWHFVWQKMHGYR